MHKGRDKNSENKHVSDFVVKVTERNNKNLRKSIFKELIAENSQNRSKMDHQS